MTFAECLLECSRNADLVREYDRLTGSSLSKLGSRTPVDRMVGQATGYDRVLAQQFAAFVYKVVWSRLPRTVGEE